MNGETPEGHENLSGMTLNERLSVTGLRADFDKAIYAGDEEAAVALLRRVRMEEGPAWPRSSRTLAGTAIYA